MQLRRDARIPRTEHRPRAIAVSAGRRRRNVGQQRRVRERQITGKRVSELPLQRLFLDGTGEPCGGDFLRSCSEFLRQRHLFFLLRRSE